MKDHSAQSKICVNYMAVWIVGSGYRPEHNKGLSLHLTTHWFRLASFCDYDYKRVHNGLQERRSEGAQAPARFYPA
jgi:hypothetical protein